MVADLSIEFLFSLKIASNFHQKVMIILVISMTTLQFLSPTMFNDNGTIHRCWHLLIKLLIITVITKVKQRQQQIFTFRNHRNRFLQGKNNCCSVNVRCCSRIISKNNTPRVMKLPNNLVLLLPLLCQRQRERYRQDQFYRGM